MKYRMILLGVCLLLLAGCSSAGADVGGNAGTGAPAASAPELQAEKPPRSSAPETAHTPGDPDGMEYYTPLMTALPPVEVRPSYTLHAIDMPVSEAEKTVHNSFIYDLAFSLELCLPDGWTVREAAGMEAEGLETFETVDGLWSVLCILDEEQVPVGSIGYTNAEGHGTFSMINMAKHSFICDYGSSGPMSASPFTPLFDDGNFLLAMTEVRYDHPANEQLPCTYNWGILAEDDEIGVVVAIELDHGIVDGTDYDSFNWGELRYIAETVRIRPVDLSAGGSGS